MKKRFETIRRNRRYLVVDNELDEVVIEQRSISRADQIQRCIESGYSGFEGPPPKFIYEKM